MWCAGRLQRGRVAGMGCYVPPMGGKRMLRAARKMSVPHMVSEMVEEHSVAAGCRYWMLEF